jgi:Flp pilus assembly protein TadG
MVHASKRRSGAVIVLVALCLIAMLGIVAISLDGGFLLDQRRRLQSAADAAALAAAIDLYINYPTNNGLECRAKRRWPSQQKTSQPKTQ